MKLTKEETNLLKDLILENISIEGLPQIHLKLGEKTPEIHLTLSLGPVLEYVEGIINVQINQPHKQSILKKIFDFKRFSKTLTLFRSVFIRIPEIYK